MKLNRNFLVAIAFLGTFAFAKAQLSEECTVMLQIYAGDAKAGNYTEAFKQLNPLIEKCPDASAAIYQYGAIIYQNRLDNNLGDEKANVHGLIEMINAQITKYPSLVDVTRKKVEIARINYKYKMGTASEQYDEFNTIFNDDKANFTDPNAIITYFTLAKGEFDAGNMDLKGLFVVYDALSEKINEELDTRSKQVSDLGDKVEDGSITDAEKQTLENQKINLSNYDIVSGSLSATIGKLVGCDYLIPLYDAEFEENKNDEVWLTGVLNRLSNKDCTDAPIFLKTVKALHVINPTAKTAYGLGVIAKSETEKFKYWDEALALGVTNDLEAKIHYAKATALKKKGQYAQAKSEYLAAVRARASYGNAYLQIANMIASSASSCGTGDIISQKAVYLVAARWAEKAASVDGSVRSQANQYAANYRAKGPSKQDIFTSGGKYSSGQSLRVGCWIGESVTLP